MVVYYRETLIIVVEFNLYQELQELQSGLFLADQVDGSIARVVRKESFDCI